MRNLILLFLFISSFCLAQMPDISTVWLNKHQTYFGTISSSKTPLKFKVDLSSQDKKKDQEYFVSGSTTVDRNLSNFEGKIVITQYRNSKKGGKVFGEYEFLEEPKDRHSGVYKGKFIYTFKFNRKTQKIESEYLEFVGDWENYAKTLTYRTGWKNQ